MKISDLAMVINSAHLTAGSSNVKFHRNYNKFLLQPTDAIWSLHGISTLYNYYLLPPPPFFFFNQSLDTSNVLVVVHVDGIEIVLTRLRYVHFDNVGYTCTVSLFNCSR